jgi:hypothetical protein
MVPSSDEMKVVTTGWTCTLDEGMGEARKAYRILVVKPIGSIHLGD